MVSPSNKTPGDEGFDKYRAKQREVLAGQAHLIEIDLLRAGTHVTAVPRDIAKEKAGPFDYHVSVHRFDRPKELSRLSDPTATAVARRSRSRCCRTDPPVQLDLQAAFNRAYDAGPYRKTIWYGEGPDRSPRLRTANKPRGPATISCKPARCKLRSIEPEP